MNPIQTILFSFLMFVFAIAVSAQDPKNDLLTVCYKTSMDCHNCELTLTNFLKFEKGVKDLKVDLKTNTIKVVYKSGKNTVENLAQGIKKQGYEANPITETEYKNLVGETPKK